MPKPLLVETSEKKEPIFLLYGTNIPIIEFLLKKYTQDFKVIHITDLEFKNTKKNYYKISKKSLSTINNLEDEISYSVFFLEEFIDKDNLYKIIAKLLKDKTILLVVINLEERKKYYDILLELKKNENIRVAFLGDVFGDFIDYKNSKVSKIIQTAFTNKTAYLSGNGTDVNLSISDIDFFSGINHILFSHKTKNNIYYLFYSHPEKYISIIHLLNRIEPDLSIVFKDDENTSPNKNLSEINDEIFSKLQIKPMFLDKYLLGFEKSVRYFLNSKKPAQIKEKKNEENNKQNIFINGIRKLRPLFLYAFVFFIMLHFVFATLGFIFLRQAKIEFEKNNLLFAQKLLKQSFIFISPIKPSITIADAFFSKLINNRKQEMLFISKDIVNMLSDTNSFLSELLKIREGTTEERLNSVLAKGRFLFFGLEKMQFNNFFHSENFVLEKKLSNFLSASGNISEILGFDKDKTYLLLFLNNGELRSSGGFTGSIGEVTLSKGNIKKIQIEDVYSVDGQLKAHVEPHFIVRRYLQPHLYLRDSNFSLSFENNASTSALIYNLSLNKKVDGVIGITFEAVRRIIGEIGSIPLEKYNIVLDENNAFDFIQNEIESNKFAGSLKKKEILNTIFNNLSLRLEDKNNFYKIASIIPSLISEKQILFAFETPSIQKAFSVNGLAGNLFDFRTKVNSGVYDFLSINEANIGVNKANTQIERRVDYDIFIKDSSLLSKATLTLKSTKTNAPLYKSYVRFVAPFGSKLKSITIDGSKQNIVSAVSDFRIYESKVFIKPEGLEVDTQSEDDNTSFGFIVNINPGKKQIIEVEYENALSLSEESFFTYSLLFIKQPGTMSFPLSLHLHYGDDIIPREVKNASLLKNEVVIEKNIKGDEILEMKLLKK